MKPEFILPQQGRALSTAVPESLGSSGEGWLPWALLLPPGARRAVIDHRLAEGNVQFKAAWIFAAVFLATVFTA